MARIKRLWDGSHGNGNSASCTFMPGAKGDFHHTIQDSPAIHFHYQYLKISGITRPPITVC
ncbi:hypothetical protein B0I35DRAFT_423610 [Stachybotrys elegans]|uniref:Uncharacterized protein n=1 Tax=Stachybotrys elegans TaxID=80388 RepID=A0A8K0T040_9HYPO|nr:hypothetical protein B0I35DRAFT_423610 [Stachybotrys elegans]